MDDIVNHNVEHRFFLYFVFESPIFRVDRTSYYTGCRPVDYERAALQWRSRPVRDTPGSIAYPTRRVEAPCKFLPEIVVDLLSALLRWIPKTSRSNGRRFRLQKQ